MHRPNEAGYSTSDSFVFDDLARGSLPGYLCPSAAAAWLAAQ
jgi:hypothetical protein